MNRKRKLAWNGIMALVKQLVALVCGFVLPRYILEGYGSNVNGLISSVTQFLSFIVFLEMGIGPVVQSNLYKPLAQNDSIEISKIYLSGKRFFRKIAYIFVIYIAVLIIVFPYITDVKFGWLYTGSLIVIISISSFAQYYFGIINQVLLNADQKAYIQFSLHTGTLVLNTLFSVILIRVGVGIHLVKLVTALLFLIRPICMMMYVNRHYDIDRSIVVQEEPIKQKWNGFAQHIASVVLDGTDLIVLTFLSTLENVSIYSVYHLVVLGVKQLFLSLTTGIKSLLGELWAKQELDELNKTFGWMEWVMHMGTIFVFGCVGILIVPFVRVYTNGVSDVNYIQPLFAVLITLANAGHCLRLPYNVMILAAGHYKQTQSNYIVAAVLNIVISILTVNAFGLIGVAIGTLVAMVYQTVWMAIYVSKNLIKWPIKNFVKQVAVDGATVFIAVFLSSGFELAAVNYFQWVILAVKVGIVWLVVVAVINLLFYREKMKYLLGLVKKRL